MAKNNENPKIVISQNTKDRLDRLQLPTKGTYNDIIIRLLDLTELQELKKLNKM